MDVHRSFFLKNPRLGMLISIFDKMSVEKQQTLLTHAEKQDLPSNICIVCNKPFTWRKKWEKNWSEVKYCSQKCRNNK
jgi:hypothetical protein